MSAIKFPVRYMMFEGSVRDANNKRLTVGQVERALNATAPTAVRRAEKAFILAAEHYCSPPGDDEGTDASEREELFVTFRALKAARANARKAARK